MTRARLGSSTLTSSNEPTSICKHAVVWSLTYSQLCQRLGHKGMYKNRVVIASLPDTDAREKWKHGVQVFHHYRPPKIIIYIESSSLFMVLIPTRRFLTCCVFMSFCSSLLSAAHFSKDFWFYGHFFWEEENTKSHTLWPIIIFKKIRKCLNPAESQRKSELCILFTSCLSYVG